MTKIGYARVSTSEQEINLQLDALKAEGCLEKNIFIDKVSGSKKERLGLTKALSILKAGDTLVVWRLDGLGRSMSHLVSLMEELRQNKIFFKSICDGIIDTTTASGELILNIFSCLAQFERRLIIERTKAGLSAARARGRLGGRNPITIDNPKVRMANKMYADKSIEIRDICKTLNISRPTLYRYVNMK